MGENDQTLSQDISKSVDQLCTQLSVANIVVPRIDKFKDVYDWINEYELVTATLPDDQRARLLVKAFPPGRLAAWFTNELRPISTQPWKTIKNRVIERFSDTEDRDRHFRKLKEMKFDPKGQHKLYDYVEDLLYSFSKAIPENNSDDTKIRYAKSNLPSEIRPSLCLINDYNLAKDVTTFMKGIKQYDVLKGGLQVPTTCENSSEKVKPLEIANFFKEVIQSIRQEAEATRNVVAAINTRPREQSPFRSRSPNRSHMVQQPRDTPHESQAFNVSHGRALSPYPGRSQVYSSRSPQRFNDRQQTHQNYGQQYSPGSYNQNDYYQNRPANPHDYQRQRSQSPGRGTHTHTQNVNQMQNVSTGHSYPTQRNNTDQMNRGIYDEKQYYAKFKVPPSPCPNCQHMHWERHCVNHLN